MTRRAFPTWARPTLAVEAPSPRLQSTATRSLLPACARLGSAAAAGAMDCERDLFCFREARC